MNNYFKLTLYILLIFIITPILSYSQIQKFTISTSIQFPSEKSDGFKNAMYKITPRAIYNLNSNFSLGVFYSYLGGNNSNTLKYMNNDIYIGKIYDIKNNGNFAGIMAQYTFLNYQKFRSFIDIETGYGILTKKIKNGYFYDKETIKSIDKSDYKEVDEKTLNKLINDWNIPLNNVTDNHAGYSTSKPKSNVLISNINLGGRYDFYNGLGIELRLSNIVSYSSSKVKQTKEKESEFTVVKNIPNNISFGLSYSF